MPWSFATEADMQRVVNSVGVTERLNTTTRTGKRRPASSLYASWFGVTEESIDAADWDADPPTIGSGDVRLYRLIKGDDADPKELEVVSETELKTCYNIVPASVAKNKIVVIMIVGGLPVVVVESCASVSIVA